MKQWNGVFQQYRHIWVIRQAKSGGAWEWVQPLAVNLQFTPRGSARRAVKS